MVRFNNKLSNGFAEKGVTPGLSPFYLLVLLTTEIFSRNKELNSLAPDYCVSYPRRTKQSEKDGETALSWLAGINHFGWNVSHRVRFVYIVCSLMICVGVCVGDVGVWFSVIFLTFTSDNIMNKKSCGIKFYISVYTTSEDISLNKVVAVSLKNFFFFFFCKSQFVIIWRTWRATLAEELHQVWSASDLTLENLRLLLKSNVTHFEISTGDNQLII